MEENIKDSTETVTEEVTPEEEVKNNKKEKHKKDNKIDSLTTLIEEMKAKLDDANNKYMRAQAEVINFKRRKEEETSARLRYCNEDILKELLPIIDNFERAIKMDDTNLTDEVSKFLQGFKMIYANMLEVLKQNDVTEIEVLDKPFDPRVSEAVIVEHYDDKEPHVVVDVLQKGYMYKDRILRPAMVKIND